MKSDSAFLIARKYGFLRARILLYRQDELSALERNLVRLDYNDDQQREFVLQSRRIDEQLDQDPVNSRKALIERIDVKLKQDGKDSILYFLTVKSLFALFLIRDSLQMTW